MLGLTNLTQPALVRVITSVNNLLGSARSALNSALQYTVQGLWRSAIVSHYEVISGFAQKTAASPQTPVRQPGDDTHCGQE